jgi:hypothetical protein
VVSRSTANVACFFKRGVDSFFSFLKHRDETTHLIFEYEFDIFPLDEALRAQRT